MFEQAYQITSYQHWKNYKTIGRKGLPLVLQPSKDRLSMVLYKLRVVSDKMVRRAVSTDSRRKRPLVE